MQTDNNKVAGDLIPATLIADKQMLYKRIYELYTPITNSFRSLNIKLFPNNKLLYPVGHQVFNGLIGTDTVPDKSGRNIQ